MNNVPVRFALLSAGILLVGIMAGLVGADTVVQITLNGEVPGIFGNTDNYQIQLFDGGAPITVTNFLRYVNNADYSNTIIHRVVPDFIIQGGGFELVNSGGVITAIDPITTYGAIQNEFSSDRSNIRGTIAMAKLGSDPNSATSQWFVNLADNSSNLDNQNGGFTVFGQVAGEGMTIVDTIANLTTYNINEYYDPNWPLYKDINPEYGPYASVPLYFDSTGYAHFITVLSASVVSTTAWKGGVSGATTNWDQTANWATGSVPNGVGANLSIGSQATANNQIDLGASNKTVGNIYFTSKTGTTIKSDSSKSLIINNNGKTSLINVIGEHSISAAMVLNNNTLVSVDGSMDISGAISGSGSLALNNLGKLTLAGENTYTGQTLVTSGSLLAAKAASLPGYDTAGKVVVSVDALLSLQAGADSGEWTSAQIDTLQSTATFEDGAFLGIDTSNGDFTHNGALTGGFGFAKMGSNVLTLTGTNTYTGKTFVFGGALDVLKPDSLPGYNSSGKVTVYSGGTLAVRAGATGEWTSAQIDTLRTNVTFNSGSYIGIDTTGDNFTYGSNITGSIGLTKLGSNTLTLTGTNSFTGAVNFNGGLIKVGTSSKLGSGTALNFDGGGLQFDGTFDPSARTMTFLDGGATLDTQGNEITLTNPIGNGGAGGLTKTGSGALILGAVNTFSGAVNFNGGLIKALALNGLGTGTELNFNGGGLQFAGLYDPSVRTMTFLAGGATLDTQGNDITLTKSVGNDGAGGLTKQGTGALNLSVSPKYLGATIIQAGLIKLGTGVTLPSTTAVSLTGSGAQLDLNSNSQTIISLAGVAGSEVKLGNSVLTINEDTSTEFAGAITGGTNGAVIKKGAGTLTLSGTNTFPAALSIKAGYIKAKKSENLGSGWLNFDGGGLQFDAVFDPSNHMMSFLNGGATLDTQVYNISLSNPIGNSGTGGLTKKGSGTLTLSAPPKYIGATVINGGTLQLGLEAILPSSMKVSLTASGAKLDINGNSQILTSITGVAGSEVKLGGGTLTVNNDVLVVFDGNLTSLSGGNLTKSGTGILELTGGLSYGGATTINNGTLKINNNLGTTLSDISGAGGLDVDGASTVLTVSSVIVGKLTLGPGAKLKLAASASGPTAGSDLVIAAVPEPGISTLLSVAALALIFAAWMKKRGN